MRPDGKEASDNVHILGHNGPGNVTVINMDAREYYSTVLKVAVVFADAILPS